MEDERTWPESRKLSSLEPDFCNRLLRVIHRLRVQGYQVKVVYAGRFAETQRSLMKRGLSKVEDPYDSKHVFPDDVEGPTARAADLVDERYWWGDLDAGQDPEGAMRFFGALGLAAKEEGLFWGGDYKNWKDYAHVEGV